MSEVFQLRKPVRHTDRFCPADFAQLPILVEIVDEQLTFYLDCSVFVIAQPSRYVPSINKVDLHCQYGNLKGGSLEASVRNHGNAN